MKRVLARAANRALRPLGLSLARASDFELWGRYRRDALALASAVDCNPRLGMQQNPGRIAPLVSDRTCNWFLPVFDRATYGGIMTALRLAAHLTVEDGVRNRFIICGPCDTDSISRSITSVFPALSRAPVIALNGADAMACIPPSDYSVATLWTTAYVLAGVENTGTKFYLIQDFEPEFYPAGTTSAQAEWTYSFGFYGIANTPTLAEIYRRDYSGTAVALMPAVDTSVFFSTGIERSAGTRRLFYYARPSIPRNGFELAAATLKLVKAKLGSDVEILCAGADWNPADYGLSSVVTSLGMLSYKDTGDLYRSCHAGLALMMTRHPSYLPFELMACGALVIANANRWNTWLLRDGANCVIAPPTVSGLSQRIVEALSNYDDTVDLRIQGFLDVARHHSDWKKSLSEVTKFIHATADA